MATPVSSIYGVAAGQPIYGGKHRSGFPRGATLGAAVAGGALSSPVNSLLISGPSSGLERTMSGLFTVTHTGTLSEPINITLSDGVAYTPGWSAVKFWPIGIDGGLSSTQQVTLTLSPSSPSASFFYVPGAAGAKSITLTNDGGQSNPAAHTYTSNVYTAPSATPFRLTRGGSTIGSYATLQACKDSGGWQSGDVVKCTGGTYVVYGPTDPGCTLLVDNPGGTQTGVNVNALTIEWETPGVPMVLDYSRFCAVGMWSGGQPQLLTMGIACHDLTVRGLHFRGYRTPFGASWLGAGIWTLTDYPAATGATAKLTVEYCKFQHLPDGIKTRTHYNFSTFVRSCVFEDNSDAKGLDHDIYTGSNELTHVEGCTFRKTAGQGYPQDGMGHFIKSRSRVTTIRGNLLDGYMEANAKGGVAQLINTPNGGIVEITGNTLLHYGYKTEGTRGEPLRYGDDQHTTTSDTSTNPALTAHSLLFAQNTVRQYAAHTVGTLNAARPLQLFPTGDSFTVLLTGSGGTVAPTATIQNNIMASQFTARLSTFIGLYPNNTTVDVSTINDTGVYSGGDVAGSPAVAQAPFEWGGDFIAAIARTDTMRGSHSEAIPTWVPATAWAWTTIPGTQWNLTMRPTSSGGVAPSQAGDPVGSSYDAQWSYGGIAYSRKNHEMWLWGGGHDGTTINALSKWNLGSNSPGVSMVCAPTAVADRLADWALGNTHWYSSAYHTETNPKPKSVHAYSNSRYFDDVDEFVAFGLSAMDDPGGGSGSKFEVAGFPRSGSNWRADGYWPMLNTEQGSYGTQNQLVFESHDRTAIYYARKYTSLFKYTSAGVKTTIGGMTGGVVAYVMKGCAESATRALIGGGIENSGGTGWRLWFVDLTTGAATAITVTGAWPSDFSNYQYYNIAWVESLGKYFALLGDVFAANTGPNVNNLKIFELTPTGASTIAAVEKTLTGTRPIRMDLGSAMEYDPGYGALIIAASPGEPLFTLKVN